MLQTNILNRSDNHVRLGHATLDRPKALNALSLELIQELSRTLQQWKEDSSIDGVLLDSAIEKAFCAGGDVKALINHPGKNRDDVLENAQRYFQSEYALDHLIHTYSKPLICWGDGFILGGGMGLFQGARCRITTERSILAMPEIAIGLFPDVGASYFLNRLPEYLGLFLGITGYKLSGSEALIFGLADYHIASSIKAEIIEDLLQVRKSECLTSRIHQVFRSAPRPDDANASKTPLLNSLRFLQSLITPEQFWQSIERLRAASQQPDNNPLDESLLTAITGLFKGSVLSARLTWLHLRSTRTRSLGDCFTEDLKTALLCFEHGDFTEGVRALLIDKDLNPKWRFSWNDSPERIDEYLFSKFSQR
jgi:enoyl-CoA hydratase/carnithine racemase